MTNDALLAVRPGSYLVRFRDATGIREEQVDVPRGETYPLIAKRMDLVPPGQSVRKGIAERKRAAVALTVGGGLIGPTSPKIGFGPLGSVGVMFDFEPITLIARATGSWHDKRNAQIALRQARVGGDIAGVKKIDLGPTAFGLGVRAGGDGVIQWFRTEGIAPPRSGATGRLGPVLSLDIPFGRNLAVVGIGTDVQLYQRYDPVLEAGVLDTAVVPSFQLELARYVR